MPESVVGHKVRAIRAVCGSRFIASVTAMLETANWTVFGITGRIGTPARTSGLRLQRWVPTGTRLRIEGRAKSTGPSSLTVALEAFTSDGQSVATLERDFVLPNRQELLGWGMRKSPQRSPVSSLNR